MLGQAAATVYKRPITNKMVPLISQQGNGCPDPGKKMFREALETGNMESYFHLSDQFVTQVEPSTCGPSTLVMALNALEIDPRTKWKGIWRWFSEENLNHLPTKDDPLTLGMFAELAKANYCSVQMFYHQDAASVAGWNGKRSSCQFGMKQHQCHMEHDPLQPKSASLETFRRTISAMSRLSGMYPILNYSRKTFGQTGDGHYSPVAGYHRGEDSTLIMDVARFKYPSHWMDIPTIYESLKEIDPQSGFTRGFVILSRHPKLFSDLCRVAVDCTLLNSFSKFRQSKKYKDWVEKLRSLNDLQEKSLYFLEGSSTFDSELGDLLALYVINMSFYLDSDREFPHSIFDQNGKQAFEKLLLSFSSTQSSPGDTLKSFTNTHLPSAGSISFSANELKHFPLLQLLQDYQPTLWQHLLPLLIYTLEQDGSKRGTAVLSASHKELLQQSQKHLFV